MGLYEILIHSQCSYNRYLLARPQLREAERGTNTVVHPKKIFLKNHTIFRVFSPLYLSIRQSYQAAEDQQLICPLR